VLNHLCLLKCKNMQSINEVHIVENDSKAARLNSKFKAFGSIFHEPYWKDLFKNLLKDLY